MLNKLKKKIKKVGSQRKTIQITMERTGWSFIHALREVSDAKKRLGISGKDYNKYELFQFAPEEQKQKYEDILTQRKTEKEKKKKKQKKTRTKNKWDKYIRGVMEATGWDYAFTVSKIEEARKRTGCAYKEYLLYRFFELDEKEQEQVFLIRDSRKMSEKYDVNKEFVTMLCNKELTNEYFSYCLKRPWCVNTKITLDDFTKKFADSKRIIYKPLDGNRGRGVQAFDIDRSNAKEVYEKLVFLPEGVVEQYVVQHHEMSVLSPSSVNTIRIVTVSSNTRPVTPDGKYFDVAYAALRIGGGTAIVDNFHSGGMCAAVDLETGELVTDAADMEGHVFCTHPATGVVIKGFRIPYFAEAVEMVTDAWKRSKIEGYLGWDIAITEEGPVLIEINLRPGVVLLSTPYVAEKKGMKYVMEKYM